MAIRCVRAHKRREGEGQWCRKMFFLTKGGSNYITILVTSDLGLVGKGTPSACMQYACYRGSVGIYIHPRILY